MPKVPNIIRDAPHLCILSHFLYFIERRRAGRETEYDWALGLAKSHAQYANFVAFVRTTADAVNFDEVNSPTGVELGNGVVVGLCSRLARINAVVVVVPWTGIVCVSRISRVVWRSCNGKIGFDCSPGNTAKNMNTKLQAEAMHIISQWFESGIIGGRGETAFRWRVAAIVID